MKAKVTVEYIVFCGTGQGAGISIGGAIIQGEIQFTPSRQIAVESAKIVSIVEAPEPEAKPAGEVRGPYP